jgi:lysophospholipase L1-like esterase
LGEQRPQTSRDSIYEVQCGYRWRNSRHISQEETLVCRTVHRAEPAVAFDPSQIYDAERPESRRGKFRITEEAMKISKWYLAAGLFLFALAQPGLAAPRTFQLRNGDRVLFYGDSITEQRYWTVAVETYVRTRFPNLQVTFRNSAVGGATVTGNWIAPVDQSLERDVFPFKPNIVTIMLGMNDGKYRPFNQAIFDTYREGYRHIIQSLRAHLPGVKIVLIQPTPWDDITAKPSYLNNPDHAPGGYDSVMRRYCQFVRKLGAGEHLQVVDFHTPLIQLMKGTEETEPWLAGKIIPGRIHPGASAQLVMAQTMLKAWDAPAMVSRVVINASKAKVSHYDRARVTGLSSRDGQVTWTETDDALPYPIMTLHSTKWPQFPPDPWSGWKENVLWPLPPLESSTINPVTALAVKLSGMYQALDSETLRISGLKAGEYALTIDSHPVGKFTGAQLARGIDLARYDTPMMEQADKVLTLVWHRVDVRFYGWRAIQAALRYDKTPGLPQAIANIVNLLDGEQQNLIVQTHAAAQSQAHHYVLTPVAP